MITGTDIVYISSIEWNFLWQIHQEVAVRFAEAGNRVLYVENTGVRSPGLRDAGRVGLRLKRWMSASRSSGVREVAPNVFVCSPLVLPPFGSPFRRQINRRLLLPAVKRAAERLDFKDPLFWTYLPTDTALDIFDLLKTAKSKLLYYCVADFSVLASNKALLKKSEQQLVCQSDLIFATCPALAGHCEQWTKSEIHLFPSGVDMKAFPVAPNLDSPMLLHEPGLIEDLKLLEELKSGGNPVIGYVGGLHRFIDQDLIAEMARMRPNWKWVFVGSIQTPVDRISSLENVYLLGQRPHSDLAYYLGKFSSGIIPYINAVETATVVPVKLKEYLAAEKPVVSTCLPAVVDFNNIFQVVTLSDAAPAQFLLAIEESIESDSLQGRRKRREVAELSDWSARIDLMSQLIASLDKNAKVDLSNIVSV